MNTAEQDKLKHDFINSIVIINSMTKSATNFLIKLSKTMNEDDINKKEVEKFLHAMSTILDQTATIENFFHHLMNE